MKSTDFQDYVNNRYKQQIEWYDSKSQKNQWIYKVLQIIIIILSFSTPVIIALSYDSSKIISILVSSMVAILSTTIATFKFYENWINYRTTCESLKKEKHYYDFHIGPYKEVTDKQSLFVERVEDLISKEHTIWITFQKKKDRS